MNNFPIRFMVSSYRSQGSVVLPLCLAKIPYLGELAPGELLDKNFELRTPNVGTSGIYLKLPKTD
jgi:hypothetical protein